MEIPSAIDLVAQLQEVDAYVRGRDFNIPEEEVQLIAERRGAIAELLLWHKSQGFQHAAVDQLIQQNPQLQSIADEYSNNPATFRPKFGKL